MKIESVNEYRVEIELADSEMAQLGISYEALNWEDIETRRAMWNIINAVRENGIDLTLSGKVLIEAGKLKNGCRLIITVLPPRGDAASVKSLVKGGVPAMLRSREKTNIEKAASFFKNAETSLYERDGVYVLAVSGDYSDNELYRAEEFCESSKNTGTLAAAFLEEYFNKCEGF
ncbi:MAG: hypothetical protein J1E34_08250 [Oscillospiraceae bacterium]|nr:hypothetical protein [Oscillospiraceae bacterium]